MPLATEPAAVSAEEEPIAAHMTIDMASADCRKECATPGILMAASLDTDARNRVAAASPKEIAKRLFSADAFRSGLNRLMARL